MKIVFMGTPDFAVPCLRELVETGFDVIHVFTQPDRPKGRGQLLTPPPVKAAALELGLPVYQPQKVKSPEAVSFLRELNPDVVVVVAFGQILSKDILETPRYGCINVHASILPKYRGAAPIHWAVINGEKESGVSIMYMDEGLDTGDVLLVEKVPIADHDTTGDLHDKLAVVGAQALVEALKLVAAGTASRTPQGDTGSTYAPLLDKTLEQINWQNKSDEVRNLIRGLNPWPGAFTYLDGNILKIWSATELPEGVGPYRGEPGEVVDVTLEQGITVMTGQGAVLITELQLQGSKRMSANAFLRGRNLPKGLILGRR